MAMLQGARAPPSCAAPRSCGAGTRRRLRPRALGPGAAGDPKAKGRPTGDGGPAKKSVVVVGAGVGGLAVAGRLARAGCHVTLCEQGEGVGGRLQSVERDGYRWDTVGGAFFVTSGSMQEFWGQAPSRAMPPSGQTRLLKAPREASAPRLPPNPGPGPARGGARARTGAVAAAVPGRVPLRVCEAGGPVGGPFGAEEGGACRLPRVLRAQHKRRRQQ
jgi:hypothetical protein